MQRLRFRPSVKQCWVDLVRLFAFACEDNYFARDELFIQIPPTHCAAERLIELILTGRVKQNYMWSRSSRSKHIKMRKNTFLLDGTKQRANVCRFARFQATNIQMKEMKRYKKLHSSSPSSFIFHEVEILCDTHLKKKRSQS